MPTWVKSSQDERLWIDNQAQWIEGTMHGVGSAVICTNSINATNSTARGIAANAVLDATPDLRIQFVNAAGYYVRAEINQTATKSFDGAVLAFTSTDKAYSYTSNTTIPHFHIDTTIPAMTFMGRNVLNASIDAYGLTPTFTLDTSPDATDPNMTKVRLDSGGIDSQIDSLQILISLKPSQYQSAPPASGCVADFGMDVAGFGVKTLDLQISGNPKGMTWGDSSSKDRIVFRPTAPEVGVQVTGLRAFTGAGLAYKKCPTDTVPGVSAHLEIQQGLSLKANFGDAGDASEAIISMPQSPGRFALQLNEGSVTDVLGSTFSAETAPIPYLDIRIGQSLRFQISDMPAGASLVITVDGLMKNWYHWKEDGLIPAGAAWVGNVVFTWAKDQTHSIFVSVDKATSIDLGGNMEGCHTCATSPIYSFLATSTFTNLHVSIQNGANGFVSNMLNSVSVASGSILSQWNPYQAGVTDGENAVTGALDSGVGTIIGGFSMMYQGLTTHFGRGLFFG